MGLPPALPPGKLLLGGLRVTSMLRSAISQLGRAQRCQPFKVMLRAGQETANTLHGL